jgi:hypothetical protein
MHLGQKLFRFLGSTLATTLGKSINDNVVLKNSNTEMRFAKNWRIKKIMFS